MEKLATNPPSIGKLKWQCRRGVLELDLLLTSFLEKKYPYLSEKQQAAFVKLLSSTDQELLSWFFSDGIPASGDLQQIVMDMRQDL